MWTSRSPRCAAPCGSWCATTDPGIAAADLPHIFEPGYRGQSADGHQGAGLGLALANRLITAADGSISAANRNGHGAVLTVTVPAA